LRWRNLITITMLGVLKIDENIILTRYLFERIIMYTWQHFYVLFFLSFLQWYWYDLVTKMLDLEFRLCLGIINWYQ
jgi:hypothetical protein